MTHNTFYHISTDNKFAAVFDTKNGNVFEVPVVVAHKALKNQLTADEEAYLNAVFDKSQIVSCKYKGTKNHVSELRLLLTNRCNFNCLYCYADHGSYGLPLHDMNVETAKNAVDYFLDHFSFIENICFFGGEPLLAIETMKKLCQYVSKLGVRVLPSYSVITNASLLDDDTLSFFKKYDIAVTASIDGPQIINDQQRILPNHAGTFDLVDGNIRNCSQKVSVSLEATYTSIHEKNHMSRSMLRNFLSNRYGTNHILISNMESSKNGEPAEVSAINLKPCGNPLLEDLRIFFEKDGVGPYTDYICMLLKVFESGRGSKFFCNAGQDKFTVDMFGNIYPCHLFVGDKKYILGNVNTKNMLNFFAEAFKDSESCSLCPYRLFCQLCTHSYLTDRELCHRNQEAIDYFLHHILEIVLVDKTRYKKIMNGCAIYLSKHNMHMQSSSKNLMKKDAL